MAGRFAADPPGRGLMRGYIAAQARYDAAAASRALRGLSGREAL